MLANGKPSRSNSMSKSQIWIAPVFLLVATLPAWAAPEDQRRADALALAGRIDRYLEASGSANGIVPARLTDDGEFLRRVTLHLAGRIPMVSEVEPFLADKDPDKRIKVVEKLLASQRYPTHMARVWRALLLPEANGGGAPIEDWLRSRFAANASYDSMVREMLTVDTANGGGGSSPISFYQAKEFKPENLADTTARLFLGVRLGCAQCHNHPFAEWKREQFWEYAAFFANVQQMNQRRPPGRQPAQPPVASTARELKIPNTDKIAKAKFLNGQVPVWTENANPRAVLADWMTSKDNPYFARAAVNRVWSIFFGIGLSDPVDEMVGTESKPSQPDLLDDLARDFAAHDFDLKYLILAITTSKAYQRSSALSHPSQDTPGQFARAPLLGMTGEQLLDSVAEATRQNAVDNGRGNGRGEFLNRFSNLSDRPTEYQTSIIQALALMNGRLTADATSLERSGVLGAVLASDFMDTPQKIETLYMATLTRKPTDKEIARATRFIDEALQNDGKPLSPEEKKVRSLRALGDLFWVLLNSGEFFFNH
jgi:hypothetical protein